MKRNLDLELASEDWFSESGESQTSLVLSRTRITCNDRAERKTFCAPYEPQKVLVVELFLPYPMCRAPDDGHRVDGCIGPPKEGDLLPFRGPHSTTRLLLCATSVFSVSLWLFLLSAVNHRDTENTEVAQRSRIF